MKNKTLLILVLFFLLGYFLRVFYLPTRAVNFGYDMARDAFTVKDLLSGDLKLQGPPASTPGLFHGVLYYYVIAPAYFFGKGNPVVVAYWTAFINAATVFVVFSLSYVLTRKKGAALLSAFLYAISFGATQYATWISNPTLGVITVPLIYLGLWMWFREKNKWGPPLAALGLGLSIQAEIFLAYHFFPVGFWLIAEGKKIKRHDLIIFIVIFLITVSSMILTQLRNGGGTVTGVVGLLTAKDQILESKSFGDFIVLYLNQMGTTFSNVIFPSIPGWGGLAGFSFLIFAIRQWFASARRQLFSWQMLLASFLLAHLPIVFLGGVSTPFLTVGLGVGVCALFGIILYRLSLKNKYVAAFIVLVIVISNLSAIFTKNRNGQVALVWNQNDLMVSKEVAVVDYTYKEADGAPFSINTVTNPLWVNTTWSYLYNWYGLAKYGYLPQWSGRDQVGRPGNNLSAVSPTTTLQFLIEEPPGGLSEGWIRKEEEAENSRSILLEERNFGKLVVQKRTVLAK